MEAQEVSELQENQEHGSESGLKHVSFSMSLLAVLLAMTAVMGHRTHTEAVLQQARASDQWNLYQARKMRAFNAKSVADVLTALHANSEDVSKLAEKQSTYAESETDKATEEQNKAKEIEEKVELAERKAERFDLGEALLQIGVIITSITLLTRKQIYWHLGTLFGVGGIVAAALAFFVH
jgi:uncharacterized membrane protein YeiB